jgi:hypothetical protein
LSSVHRYWSSATARSLAHLLWPSFELLPGHTATVFHVLTASAVPPPEDVRGYSCLVLGTGDGVCPIHIVCSPKPDYLPSLLPISIIAYLPHPDQWSADFKERK